MPTAGRCRPGFDATRLHALVERRHAELNDAIARRQWFDPWVFELADDDDAARGDPMMREAMMPCRRRSMRSTPGSPASRPRSSCSPALMALDATARRLTEPLALVYRHLAPDDLEDADELLAEIESLEPPADLAEAVEGLVRATLLLADVTRPLAADTDAGNR